MKNWWRDNWFYVEVFLLGIIFCNLTWVVIVRLSH